MQIQRTTDYAMRILAHMYTQQAMDKTKLVKARGMAENLGIDYQYSMKVINQLRTADLVKSVQGCTGGYYLDNSVEDITFYDVIKIMEGEIYINKCLEEGECTRKKDRECPIQCEMHLLQDALVGKLKEIKLAEVCAEGF